MSKGLDEVCAAMEGIGGFGLLLAAIASDGGLALGRTVLWAGAMLAVLLLGAAGRALCARRARALRRRAQAGCRAALPADARRYA